MNNANNTEDPYRTIQHVYFKVADIVYRIKYKSNGFISVK